MIPEDDGEKGKAFVWIGSKAKPTEATLLEEITKDLLNREEYPVEVITEGEEPPLFWKTLGGKKPYETNADFMLYSRLFRCTNEKGYFVVSEKTIDFCQVIFIIYIFSRSQKYGYLILCRMIWTMKT